MSDAPAPRQAAPAPRTAQLLPLAAESREALEAATDRLAERLEAEGADLAAVARGLAARADGAHRRVLVAQDMADAAAALRARDPQRLFTAGPVEGERSVAFLFPGLGEQYVGMARGLYRAEPVFREALDRCAEWLAPHLETDLRTLLFPDRPEPEAGAGKQGIDLRAMLARIKSQGDEATRRLNRTENAQPAVWAVEVALARLWLSWGVRPAGTIGHSLGEYAAATVGGVLPEPDAAALVARRARLVAELPEGVMLAVPLSEEEVRPLLGEHLSVGAVNEPASMVVSGPEEAVAALEARLAERELVSRRLPTTHAFHSAMMEPVVPRFAELLGGVEFGRPELPWVSNVTGDWVRGGEVADPSYWTRHLVGTVRFADGVRVLAEDPERVFLEVGPGQTLGAFARQSGAARQVILPSLRPSYVRQPDTAFALESLGRLWIAGVPVRWEGLFPGADAPEPADAAGVYAG